MGSIEPLKDLRKNILLQIGREERRRARAYLLGSSIFIALSLGGIVFSVQYLIQGFYHSSFYSFLSLLFSDPDIALLHWKEFAFSLIETIPMFEITLSLVALSVLLVSIRVFVTNARSTFVPSFRH